ncbi:G-patch domain and KOW motifs-containing protein [Toxorhynchites rutilus septentrionalis]|uniref:G-patch domain and KOW motifs-containing protein n=1 Tax=Toxorhynchites rutilus septentrionalis TaxID=329112 RepID=UPI00247A35FC|nr:G-patch domain and KOW motifs-containing protein [Toxorhynchites rutilus septentrionalis]
METKKVSFGFSKVTKKTSLQGGPAALAGRAYGRNEEEKIEIIACLEGQSIKIVGKENGSDEQLPLVIPLRDQDKTTVPSRLAKLKEIQEDKNKQQTTETTAALKVETLEQKAAREILEDLKGQQELADAKDNLVVALKPEDLPLEGAVESTMDDYESMPIQKFGMALLRGMGWKEDPNAPKKDDKLPDGPVLRPKGMGLGAERVPKDKTKLLIPPAKDEALVMQKGAFVKVLAGKHKDCYGTVETLDEETGRVLVRLTLKANQEFLMEYLLQLVSKAEYKQYSNVLNNAKYNEYLNRAAAGESTTVKEEKPDVRKIKREPSDSPPPARYQFSRSDRQVKSERRVHKDTRSPSRSDRHSRKDRNDRHSSPSPPRVKRHDRAAVDGKSNRTERTDRDTRRDAERDGKRREEKHSSSRRHRRDDVSSSSSDDSESESDDRGRSRHQHKSSSYVRTSSGTKKKSHKYKQRRDHSRDRVAHSSDEDDRRHKKKTKRSKKQRSRSRSRR